MDNNTYLHSSLFYSHNVTAGVEGNPGFLFGYLCLGLTSFFLAFWAQRGQLKDFKESFIYFCSGRHDKLRGVQNIHSALITLLFVDFLNAIATTILVVQVAVYSDYLAYTSVYVLITWFLLRFIGLVLHLLNALLCLLFLSHPQCGAKLRWFLTGILVLITVVVAFYVLASQVAAFAMAVIIFGLALAIIAKCTASTTSPAAAAWKRWIVIVAMVTFLVVYVPPFVLQCLFFRSVYSGEPNNDYLVLFLNVLFGTNIHLIMDGLQCFFILRFPTGVEEQ
ncbi:uncharacterized protein LOC111661741 [Seriola lalandi dorsalis]|uniref:uncharacterized protein LOC111661741 n=1 Tax=Seriola lalandi dorsalis TaxID=1841481 RepID=UPI000C6FC32C|nr:uncharacterized protein LOC111661741 [Seriola lalandi dorsalis]